MSRRQLLERHSRLLRRRSSEYPPRPKQWSSVDGNGPGYALTVPEDVGSRFVEAVATQDRTALAECFVPDVLFRALTPPGFRERTSAAEAATLVTQWFGDSTQLRLLDSRGDEVGDRLHVSYRFAGVEHGESYVVEQHLFCVVREGRIARANLLCSGFRPPTAAPE
jgi:ketosteroid isomerase-like protein